MGKSLQNSAGPRNMSMPSLAPSDGADQTDRADHEGLFGQAQPPLSLAVRQPAHDQERGEKAHGVGVDLDRA